MDSISNPLWKAFMDLQYSQVIINTWNILHLNDIYLYVTN